MRNATILIVDDQEANIELLEGFLADDYTNVKSTSDPRRALPLFNALAPDLILLDLHMPHLDGFAVMEQLQACIPPGAYVPILVLTADVSPDVKQRALSEGAKDFLSKPFDPDEVLARIKNLLETRLLHLQLENRNRILAQAMHELDAERELSEQLLLNVLPHSIADRLKHEKGIIADRFSEATVLFADIANFTPVSSRLAPEEVVLWLNDVFSSLDRLVEQHRVEKIKTIGDCYMMVSGLPTPRPDHAEVAAELALALRDEMANRIAPHGRPMRMRIGIHSGPVIAGVIGTDKFAYDLWGDTVNTASRMESHGVEGAIQVTETTYQRLQPCYEFEERGVVEIKGKGVMRTYFLTGKVK
ncbi:MAG: adenylate cyclase [Rubrobacteraceae bacterium]|nr:adenylate cyclase [Rubrobacteraceae bacterium]